MIYCSFTTDFECVSPAVDGSIRIDVLEQMVYPAMELAKVAEKNGARITYFLEIIQWEQFHNFYPQTEHIRLLDDLLQELIERGHDIQLHTHSEWVTAKYDNNKWYRQWRGRDNVHEIFSEFKPIFDAGFNRLNKLLGRKHRLLCFRAGGYYVDPVEPLFSFLRTYGIEADSSRHRITPFSNLNEKGMISLPILGEFPTSEKRWDMNLTSQSPFKFWELANGVPDNQLNFAVMIGHTKQNHNFETLESMFKLLELDENVRPVTISEQVNIIKSHFPNREH